MQDAQVISVFSKYMYIPELPSFVPPIVSEREFKRVLSKPDHQGS